jgi:hypothetical protein
VNRRGLIFPQPAHRTVILNPPPDYLIAHQAKHGVSKMQVRQQEEKF